MISITTIRIIITISFLLLLALQPHLANASTNNATQAANQTGEQMQSGMSNVTQESKSAGNQTGETAQSLMNQTGEALQQINPFK
jgi:hypothetical protein